MLFLNFLKKKETVAGTCIYSLHYMALCTMLQSGFSHSRNEIFAFCFSKPALPSASIAKNTLTDREEVAEENKDKANNEAPSLLRKTLQGEKLGIVLSLRHILQAKALKSLTDLDPLQWPTVMLVCKRLTNGSEYQGATLQHFNVAKLKSCKVQH